VNKGDKEKDSKEYKEYKENVNIIVPMLVAHVG
jgi:hypothetical protein